MTQNMPAGNMIQPLNNVAKAVNLAAELEGAPEGLPQMGLFFGPPGYGKTFAAMQLATSMGAIHITVQNLWTKRTLIEQVLKELSVTPKGLLANRMMQAVEALASANRILIIDEADYAVKKNLVETIRDFHDGAHIPIILIGMEELPQKIKQWEMVSDRVLKWTQADPGNLEDAKFLAKVYAEGISISDDLLQFVVELTGGNIRKLTKNIAYIKIKCVGMRVTEITASDWGNMPFLRNEPPAPRVGLK